MNLIVREKKAFRFSVLSVRVRNRKIFCSLLRGKKDTDRDRKRFLRYFTFTALCIKQKNRPDCATVANTQRSFPLLIKGEYLKGVFLDLNVKSLKNNFEALTPPLLKKKKKKKFRRNKKRATRGNNQ